MKVKSNILHHNLPLRKSAEMKKNILPEDMSFEELYNHYSEISDKFIPKLPVSEANKKDTRIFNEQFKERIVLIAKKDKLLACEFLKHKINKIKHAGAVKPERRMEEIYFNLSSLGPVDKKVTRGPQPSALDLRWLKEIGLVRIINLRREDYIYSGRSQKEEEKESCGKLGLDYKEFPLLDNENNPPTKEEIQQVLDCIKDSKGPVYVHCLVGQGRTGIIIAAYRMQVNGWGLKEALAEAEEYGFIPELRPNQVKILETFNPWV